MGDNNWDLGAVVRNCNINGLNNVVVPSLGIKSQTFENDVDWSFFDSFLDDDRDGIPFKGLAEFISRDLPTAHEQKPCDQSSSIINPTTLIPIQPTQFSKPIIHLPPPSPPLALRVPVAAVMCVPEATPYQLINPQQQVVMHAKVHPTFTVPSRNALIQTRRRKNQSEKIVIYELRQEELMDDTWAWRKYGQKTIRTSPFPRNYYRCSTSKSCKAKKHIERSPKAEKLFIVAYSGEHNHSPPPTTDHSYLTGRWTRGAKSKLPKGINIVPRALNFNSSSSNRSRRRSNISPIRLTTPTLEIESASANKNETVVAERKGDEKDMVVLIPNKLASEDIIRNFEELKGITCNKCASSIMG